MLEDTLERLKIGLRLGYSVQDLMRICAEGNVEMWESYLVRAKEIDELMALQKKVLENLKELAGKLS